MRSVRCKECNEELDETPDLPRAARTPCSNCGSVEDRRIDNVISASPAEASSAAIPPAVWQYYNWAMDWFADAQSQAEVTGRAARRREILFAVCCADSYLFEWVLNEVLGMHKDRFERIFEYFPEGSKKGTKQQWKEVPKQLASEGLVSGVLDMSDSHGLDWYQLIKYRNGLVHASASRPMSTAVPDAPPPVPTIEELEALPPGWALSVVAEHIRRLHAAVGTPVPEWIVSP